MDLDRIFGQALGPAGNKIHSGEDRYQPSSLTVTALLKQSPIAHSKIIAYMLSVQNGCKITSYLCGSVTILWIVDRSGQIRMAVEEAYRINPKFVTIPILRENTRGSAGWFKLGHPSLVQNEDALARIGGELQFVEDVWLLTNRSGRYGTLSDRRKEHLENVAQCLQQFGLRVEPDFLPASL